MVPSAGLEPARPFGQRILSPLRLPIPPGGPIFFPKHLYRLFQYINYIIFILYFILLHHHITSSSMQYLQFLDLIISSTSLIILLIVSELMPFATTLKPISPLRKKG